MFEREIVDHATFLRDEEEAARLEYEMECECGDWDLPEEDCGPRSVKCPAGWESI